MALTSLITQGEGLGWTSTAALGLAAATVFSLIAFVAVERLHPHPMFDFSVYHGQIAAHRAGT